MSKLNTAEQQANSLLSEIRDVDGILESIKARQAEAVKKAAEAFSSELERWENERAQLAAELVDHMKSADADLFPAGIPQGITGEALCTLPNGHLRVACRRVVRRVRGMLKTLQTIGFAELLHRTETPDWDKIEELPDEDLETLGTCRVERQTWEFGIKQPRAEAPANAA